MRYCVRCVMPNTRPDLTLDGEGVCSACRSHEREDSVDWAVRRAELEDLVSRYRGRSPSGYDCVVPVSGGKDSTWQALTARDLGLNPLLVNARTCDPSSLGAANLDALSRAGFDLLTIRPDPQVRARLNRLGLEVVGDISWPEHVAIFTQPVQAAVRYGIPLILWGENPQHLYGGPAAAQNAQVLDRAWLEEYGGLCGLRVDDLPALGFSDREIAPYRYPADEDLARVGVTGLFLGHFIRWNGFEHAEESARRAGWQFSYYPVETNGFLHENLDNYQTGIHDWFMYLKLGYGRASSIASQAVRYGRMSRSAAVEHAREWDGRFPKTYLGKDIDKIAFAIGMTTEEIEGIANRFVNPSLFAIDGRNPLPRFVVE